MLSNPRTISSRSPFFEGTFTEVIIAPYDIIYQKTQIFFIITFPLPSISYNTCTCTEILDFELFQVNRLISFSSLVMWSTTDPNESTDNATFDEFIFSITTQLSSRQFLTSNIKCLTKRREFTMAKSTFRNWMFD